MRASITIICYKFKKLSNGESPLMIRINKNGKRKLQSLGISVLPKYWNFKNNRPKKDCPNGEMIEKIILDKLSEYNEQVIEFKAENKEFTPSSLVDRVVSPKRIVTVGELFLEQIQKLKAENRTGYALSIQQVYNSLILFNKHLDIYFSDIDMAWLKTYESWLRGQAKATNTIGIRLRTLRAIYNIAIEENMVKSDYYPFKKYKVSRLNQPTAKRAISKNDVIKIINYKPEENKPCSRLAIDIFTFSYLAGGINFVDMAYLKKGDVTDGMLTYTRKKTGKLIKLPLPEMAQQLIIKYQSNTSKFIFPILSPFHQTEMQQRDRIHKVITNVNKKLKEIGRELNIDIAITTYVARHSFATVLKKSGVSTSVICESLGHSSEKVTRIYLDCFGKDQMAEAMSNLL